MCGGTDPQPGDTTLGQRPFSDGRPHIMCYSGLVSLSYSSSTDQCADALKIDSLNVCMCA